MLLIGSIPSGGGSLYEHHSAVLKAVETIPSVCHAPQLTDWNKDPEDKQPGRITCFLVCYSTVFVSSYSYVSTFQWKTLVHVALKSHQYLGWFGGSLPNTAVIRIPFGALNTLQNPYSEVNPVSCWSLFIEWWHRQHLQYQMKQGQELLCGGKARRWYTHHIHTTQHFPQSPPNYMWCPFSPKA